MISFLLTFVHVVVCFFLIAVILLQTGKRADLAGAFGGGGSQTAFGARGAATFLSRATTWCAVIFMCTSMLLALMHSRSSRSGGSVLDTSPVPAGTGVPAVPPPAPAPAPNQAPGGAPQGQPEGQDTQPPAGQAPAEQTPAPPAGDTAPPSGQGANN